MAGQDLGMPLPPPRPDPLTPSIVPAAAAPAVPAQVARPSLADAAAAPGQVAGAVAGALGGAMARPTLPTLSGVMGGSGGPTMTPQQLLAAKQASVGPALDTVFGSRALTAADQFHQDSGAQAAGDLTRAVVLGGAHAAVLPAFAIGQGLAHVGTAAAQGVSNFASGLFGTGSASAAPAAPVVPVQVAAAGPEAPIAPGLGRSVTPAQAATVVSRMAAVDPSSPYPPGYLQQLSDHRNAALAAAPVGSAPNPNVPTTRVAGPNAWETAAGLPAGAQRALLQSTKPSQRAAVAATMAATLQTQNDPTRQLKDMLTTQLAQRQSAIDAQGAAAVALPKGEARDNAVTKAQQSSLALTQLLQSIVAPPSFNAGPIPGVAQNAYGLIQPTVQ